MENYYKALSREMARVICVLTTQGQDNSEPMQKIKAQHSRAEVGGQFKDSLTVPRSGVIGSWPGPGSGDNNKCQGSEVKNT